MQNKDRISYALGNLLHCLMDLLFFSEGIKKPTDKGEKVNTVYTDSKMTFDRIKKNTLTRASRKIPCVITIVQKNRRHRSKCQLSQTT